MSYYELYKQEGRLNLGWGNVWKLMKAGKAVAEIVKAYSMMVEDGVLMDWEKTSLAKIISDEFLNNFGVVINKEKALKVIEAAEIVMIALGVLKGEAHGKEKGTPGNPI